MNPFRIRTQLHQQIDDWHFWAMVDGRRHVIFEIEMRRPRDIEEDPDEGFKFEFVARLSRKMKPADLEAVNDKRGLSFNAPSLPELRALLTKWVEAVSSEDWVKVIAVCVEPPGDYSGLRFSYGVGLRSKCGNFFRAEGERYCNDKPTFCRNYDEEFGSVHIYNEALEAGLEQIKARIDDLAAALLKLTRNPQQITASLTKLLPKAKQ